MENEKLRVDDTVGGKVGFVRKHPLSSKVLAPEMVSDKS